MKLEALLKDLEGGYRAHGPCDMEIKKLAYHSKDVEEETLFFAIAGQFTDGREYIDEALAKGAVGVVVARPKRPSQDQIQDHAETNATVIEVPDARKALAHISAEFYGRPSTKLLVIGVTGTKGKTSVTFMIRAILEEAGIKTGLIGTVFCGYEDNMIEASATTPQSLDIQALMDQMLQGGCKAVVMEVSSQGLMQSRTESIDFDIGVFTNITPDHIGDGEHRDFEEYLFWKSQLFKKCQRAIINIDDPRAGDILQGFAKSQVAYFGKGPKAHFKAKGPKLIHDHGRIGISYMLDSKKPCGDGSSRRIELNLAGAFNIENSLAAIATTKALGVPWSVIDKALGNIVIPGRVEVVDIGRDFVILLDYAHNGVALRSLLTSLREYQPARIMVVFGCGGNRDRNRRFEMGRAAMELADFIIVTSDNPRREEPMSIIQDITSVLDFSKKPILTIPNRQKAIERAVSEGRKGDIIVIAGKGHETYQIIGSQTKHFDDREVILSLRETGEDKE